VTIACPDCGALEDIPPLPPRSKAVCWLCQRVLEKTSGRSIDAALACSLGTFLLLIPSSVLPLLRVEFFGMRVENSMTDGILDLRGAQWVLIAGLSTVTVIVLPFIRFGLETLVLACLQLGYRPHWLGPAFRWTLWLDPWSMPDVFLFASLVGSYRLITLSQVHVAIGLGGACFTAAGFLTMLTRAALDQRTVWRAVLPDVEVAPGTEVLSCVTCDLVQPLACEGGPCPRCGARLTARKPDAVSRTVALLVAALLLLFPANILPMQITSYLGTRVDYTIFAGVRDLFESGLWPLSVLIFCTSILIPFGKIVAIGWCALSVRRPLRAHLSAKTKVFRLVTELGRWSNIDPFTIVFFVPLANFGALASATAGWGATAFMLMTFLTMLASKTFDPRLMWDAAASPAT
jgi:paraquat-inducible protein A